MVEDIHNIVSRMEAKVNFRVMGKDGETLSRMYDDQRESLISPLPVRCSKVKSEQLCIEKYHNHVRWG